MSRWKGPGEIKYNNMQHEIRIYTCVYALLSEDEVEPVKQYTCRLEVNLYLLVFEVGSSLQRKILYMYIHTTNALCILLSHAVE